MLAFHLCVLSVQGIPGQLVVELFQWSIPVNEIEIDPVVLQMAADAVFPLWILHPEPEVIAVLLCERLGDFLVAIQALERRRVRAKLMATRALRRSGQGLMRFRERAG